MSYEITTNYKGDKLMCNACFNDKKLKTKNIFTVEYTDSIITIKNVPCLKCAICGEIIFTDNVSEKIELIVNANKRLKNEISILDYSLDEIR